MLAEYSLFLRVVASEPVSEGACPTDREGVERAVRHQAAADAELDARRPAQAAELLGEVSEAYPECRAYHARRMMAIQRALEAHRSAFDADGERRHLVAGLTRIDRYLESLRATYGDRAVEKTGHVRLSEARAALIADLSAESAPAEPIEDHQIGPADLPVAERQQEGPHEPRQSTKQTGKIAGRSLMIGGGLAIGGGAIFLAVAISGAVRAAALDRQIEDTALGCTKSLADPCAELDQRGKAANRASVAGVVGASVLTVSGVALLGVGARRRATTMSVAPTLHPRFVGLNFQGHF